MKRNKTPRDPTGGVSNFLKLVLVWLGIGVWVYLTDKKLLISIPFIYANNISEMLWNSFLIILATFAIVKIVLTPLWRVVFQDTGKLGQKLEWYSIRFAHLTPDSKSLFLKRICVVFAISVLVAFYFLTKDRTLFRFQSLLSPDLATKYFLESASEYGFGTLQVIFIFFIIFHFGLFLEGRSRIVLRFLQLQAKEAKKRLYLKPLPERPFDSKAPNLELSFFTAFTSEKSRKKELGELPLTIEKTENESWVSLPEPGLRTGSLCIGPAGSGKTQAFVAEILAQTISWQAEDDRLKASLIVYDPKAELTRLVKEIAKDAGREKDVHVFSLNEKTAVNPLAVGNPWAGETTWKIAGWVVGAWQNFQGKSSPEPYWESQNYLLTRNLLPILFLKNHGYVTIADVSEAIIKSAEGCFKKSFDSKVITPLGEDVLTIFAVLDQEEYASRYQKLKFEDNYSSEVTEELRVRASEKLRVKVAKFTRTKEREYLDQMVSEQNQIAQGLEVKTAGKLEKIRTKVNDALIEKFGASLEATDDDIKHELILEKAQKLREDLDKKLDSNQIKEVLTSSVKWLLEAWSSNSEDNKGSVVSNMLPFLQQFQTPEIKRIFSPPRGEETISFEKLVTSGKIIVPDFAGIQIGQGLANGLITLIKSRWQHAVLSSTKNKRLKIQVMDEAQRILTVGDGDKNVGDFDYCELARSFGGINWYFSQSVAALRAKANREVEWEKIHGVIRSFFVFSTNDPSTIKFMQDIAGKEVKKRLSKTVTETANNPTMESISEKFINTTGSIGISYSESEAMEEKIQAHDLQGTDAFTALATVFDGRKNYLMKIALRPAFWPEKRDSYELMKRCEFDPERRSKFTRKTYSKNYLREEENEERSEEDIRSEYEIA